ncbi:hypothetical protein ILUMI_15802 [Ignelater luminosus]|uniref:Reverse transcriptase domain-containing protein n=1 Tax=Ignelater luminosus TaxID=2038154 RepID=A0A8K0G962_IGNLU|nr:hypothetical protein ILUMI_15802 [Ignelater luminosus]
MYNLFVNIHPQMKNVTEQRIADQRRMIVVNNKIPQTILDELKVNATIQEYQSTTQDEHIIAIDSNNYEETTQNEHIITVDRSNEEQNHAKKRFEVEAEVEKETEKAFMIRQEFEKNLIKYYGANPTKRERLPKLGFNKTTPLILHEINKIIQNKIDKDINIEEINSLIYCGAIKNCPTKEEIEGFWSNLWSKEGKYNNEARWIKDEENSNNNIPEMQLLEINENDSYTKNDHKIDPAQYRPIACLPTMYKLLTAIIKQKITEAREQKGCCQGAKECKEQLIIDSVITEQALHRKRNRQVAYIDYKKIMIVYRIHG